MNLKPVVIPAREAVQYDLYRVSLLTITQDGYGKPLYCNVRISRARQLPDGTYENAPAETDVSFTEQMGIEQLRTKYPTVANAMYGINDFAAEIGVGKGLLIPES